MSNPYGRKGKLGAAMSPLTLVLTGLVLCRFDFYLIGIFSIITGILTFIGAVVLIYGNKKR